MQSCCLCSIMLYANMMHHTMRDSGKITKESGNKFNSFLSDWLVGIWSKCEVISLEVHISKGWWFKHLQILLIFRCFSARFFSVNIMAFNVENSEEGGVFHIHATASIFNTLGNVVEQSRFLLRFSKIEVRVYLHWTHSKMWFFSFTVSKYYILVRKSRWSWSLLWTHYINFILNSYNKYYDWIAALSIFT